jgi:hypothetical protein
MKPGGALHGPYWYRSVRKGKKVITFYEGEVTK